MIVDKEKCSPMMQKYLETKEQYNDCILFYRLGDFYEMFFDDAILVSRELEITLTGKDCGLEERAPMAGIPYHAAENYIARLVSKGYKVAICEQLEDPKTTKGIVKRGVIKVVTPGTVVESNMLEERKNNYIMSVCKAGLYFGIAVSDISTGEFYSTEIKETNNFSLLMDEISRYSPAEIVANKMMNESEAEILKIKTRFPEVYITSCDESYFSEDISKTVQNFRLVDSKGNDIEKADDKLLSIASINALKEYITSTQMTDLSHINKVIIYSVSKYMSLDINARRNLEITEKLRDRSKKGTLLWVLDKTSTSMGGRLLRRWLNDPLIDEVEINKRLGAVEELKNDIMLRGEVIENLKKVYDIERLAGKMAYGNGTPRDMITLKNSLSRLPDIKQVLQNVNSEYLKEIYQNIDELKDIHELIEKSIVDDPPMTTKDGGYIKLGYDENIDTLKHATTDGKSWLMKLEADEKEKTGIKSLKIGFNKVFGYYIEVTNLYKDMVPDTYIRKQTLTNGERYITEELKNMENQILGAEEKVIKLELEAFRQIREEIAGNVKRMQKTAEAISSLDVLTSFAQVAEEMNYCKPTINKDGTISAHVPYVLPHKQLIPTIKLDNEKTWVKVPENMEGLNFSSPLNITIENTEGKTKEYKVLVYAFTGLPVMYINTENDTEITSKEEYVNAHLRIVEDIYTRSGEIFESDVTIKGRGNSTWSLPKKPYALKFDKKTSLLGEPKDKSWVLLANYTDKTNLRNEASFFMGRISNLEWTPRTHFVELFMNEVYCGTYQLCEKIKIADSRVNITDDGYLMEIDQPDRIGPEDISFKTKNLTFCVKDPDIEKNGERHKWISDYVNKAEEALLGSNFLDETEGYANYFDKVSFVDWYLINEITKNNDACFFSSCYLNITPGGKLKMGPLWR